MCLTRRTPQRGGGGGPDSIGPGAQIYLQREHGGSGWDLDISSDRGGGGGRDLDARISSDWDSGGPDSDRSIGA